MRIMDYVFLIWILILLIAVVGLWIMIAIQRCCKKEKDGSGGSGYFVPGAVEFMRNITTITKEELDLSVSDVIALTLNVHNLKKEKNAKTKSEV